MGYAEGGKDRRGGEDENGCCGQETHARGMTVYDAGGGGILFDISWLRPEGVVLDINAQGWRRIIPNLRHVIKYYTFCSL